MRLGRILLSYYLVSPLLQGEVLESGRAWLTVCCSSDATVSIEGRETRQVGPLREFVSEGLVPGHTYSYRIRLQAVRDGFPLEINRYVLLRASQSARVNFFESEQLGTVPGSYYVEAVIVSQPPDGSGCPACLRLARDVSEWKHEIEKQVMVWTDYGPDNQTRYSLQSGYPETIFYIRRRGTDNSSFGQRLVEIGRFPGHSSAYKGDFLGLLQKALRWVAKCEVPYQTRIYPEWYFGSSPGWFGVPSLGFGCFTGG